MLGRTSTRNLLLSVSVPLSPAPARTKSGPRGRGQLEVNAKSLQAYTEGRTAHESPLGSSIIMSSSRSRLPRPLTPSARTSPGPPLGNEPNPYGASMPRTIGIHIDNFGSSSRSTAISVTNQRRKSPSKRSDSRPASASTNRPQRTSPSYPRSSTPPAPAAPARANNWVNDSRNPYRQSAGKATHRTQQNPAALQRSPSQKFSMTSSVGSHGSSGSRQHSVPMAVTSVRNPHAQSGQSHFVPTAVLRRNQTGATSQRSPTGASPSAKSKLSPRAEPQGNSPKRLVSAVNNGPSCSRSSGYGQQRLRNPDYSGRPVGGGGNRGGLSDVRNVAGYTANALPQRNEVVALSDSDEDASDIIEVVPIPAKIKAKAKSTVAEQLIQSFSEHEPGVEEGAVFSPGRRSHRSTSNELRQHRSNFSNHQMQQLPMNSQPRYYSNYGLAGPAQQSFLTNPHPGVVPYFPNQYPTVAVAATPYFPPLPLRHSFHSVDTRCFSTGASRLLASDSQSSTNSQFEFMQIDGDESTENISIPEHVRQQLRKVRKWEFTTLGRLYQDSRHHGTKTMDGGTKFTVLSYNVLAPTLLTAHANHLYRNVSPDCLEWKNRHERFLTELSEFGYPDVLCFQEVEATLYKEWYETPLASHGYKGVFKKRTGDKVDGCAIFWRQSMFTLISKLSVEYSQPHVPLLNRDNVALLVKLQSKIGRRPKVVVGTTHLLFNPKRNDVKLAQVQVVISELDRFAFSGFNNKGEMMYHPIILTGDFNSEPRSSIVRFVTDGELQYTNEEGERPKLLLRNGLNDFLPPHIGISDQCQHYRVILERYNQWRAHRRNTFELDLNAQHALVNLYSSKYFQTDESKGLTGSEHGVTGAENKEIATELDPDTHSAIMEDIVNSGTVCTFGAGEISHKLRLCDIYQPKLDRSSENLHDFIATTRQNHWVCVDYIFYSKLWSDDLGRRVEGNLKLLKRLGLPTKTQCRDLGHLPSYAVSSDHFPLLAEFILK